LECPLFPVSKKQQKIQALESKLSQLASKKQKQLIVVKSAPRKSRPSNAKQPHAYLKLLKNPFDNASFGAKVSDPYSSYTDSYKLHGEFKVYAPVSISTAAYVFKPNPFLSVIDVQSWSGGTSTSSAAGWTQNPSNSSFWSSTTPAALDNVMSNYRVVAMGLRIRLEIPQQVCTGRMIVARAPRCRPDPPYAITSAHTLTYATQTSAYTPITTYPVNPLANSPFLLETPEAVEFSMIDLIGNDLTIINRPNSYEAFNFCDIPQLPIVDASSDTIGNDIFITGAGVPLTSSRDDSGSGWDDIYIYFDGLPTTTVPVCNIEYILHLEGSPNITSSTSITAVPSHPPTSPLEFLSTETIIRSLNGAAKMMFKTAPEAYTNMSGRNLLRDTSTGLALALKRPALARAIQQY